MLRKSIFLLALVFALGASQAAEFEITPLVGYRFGGEIDRDSNPVAFANINGNADVDPSESFGLAFGIRPKAGLIIELSVDMQETDVVENGQFLGGDMKIFDADISYYHVGAGWVWAREGWEGFLTGSIGVAELDPNDAILNGVPLTSEDDFSASIGGGIKVWAHKNVGFRFELRGYWANFETGEDDWWDEFDDGFYQAQARAGLVIRF